MEKQKQYPKELIDALDRSIAKRGIRATIERLRVPGRPSIVRSAIETFRFHEKSGRKKIGLRMAAMSLHARKASERTIERFMKEAELNEQERKEFRELIKQLRNKNGFEEFHVKDLFQG